MRLAFITIGQSPRNDVLNEILPKLQVYDVMVVERGVLDDVDEKTIEMVIPESKEDTLITRLRSGASVKLSRKKILPRLIRLVEELEKKADIVVLLCTDEFPELRSSRLIKPFELMAREVIRRKPKSLGVVIPLPEQERKARDKWGKVAKNIEIVPFPPYSSLDIMTKDRLEKLGRTQLVVMDCIGYSFRHKKILIEIAETSIILPREILARELERIISTDNREHKSDLSIICPF